MVACELTRIADICAFSRVSKSCFVASEDIRKRVGAISDVRKLILCHYGRAKRREMEQCGLLVHTKRIEYRIVGKRSTELEPAFT